MLSSETSKEIDAILPANEPEKKLTLLDLIKLVIGLTMLSLVIYWADPKKILHNILLADRGHLLQALILILCSHLFGVMRWQILAKSVGIGARYRKLVVLHFLGLYYNNFLPSGMGGDVVKAYYLGREAQKNKVFLSVMLDRYVGLLVLLIVSSGVAFLQPRDDFHLTLSYITWAILLAFIGGGGGMLLFSNIFANILQRYKMEKVAKELREVTLLTKGFLTSYKVVATTFIVSSIAQAFAILTVYQLSLAVGTNVSVASMFVIVPLVFMVSVLPISIGGLGARELAFSYLLANTFISTGMTVSAAKGAAGVVAVLYLALNLLVSLPGAGSSSILSRGKL